MIVSLKRLGRAFNGERTERPTTVGMEEKKEDMTGNERGRKQRDGERKDDDGDGRVGGIGRRRKRNFQAHVFWPCFVDFVRWTTMFALPLHDGADRPSLGDACESSTQRALVPMFFHCCSFASTSLAPAPCNDSGIDQWKVQHRTECGGRSRRDDIRDRRKEKDDNNAPVEYINHQSDQQLLVPESRSFVSIKLHSPCSDLQSDPFRPQAQPAGILFASPARRLPLASPPTDDSPLHLQHAHGVTQHHPSRRQRPSLRLSKGSGYLT